MATRQPKRLSKKVTQYVKDLAVKKWLLIVDNGGGTLYDYPKIFGRLVHNCSLCHVFMSKNLDKCNGCPFDYIVSDEKEIGCGKEGHLFLKWADAKPNSKLKLLYAKKILKFLENLKVA